MNDIQVKALIQKIMDEVSANMVDFSEYETLAVISEITIYAEEARDYLSTAKTVVALFGESEELNGIDNKRIDSLGERREIIKSLRNINEIVLVSPSIKLLNEIVCGDDTRFEANVFEKALLNGKKATVLLDFPQPNFKRDAFFERTTGVIQALNDMGVNVVYLGTKPLSGHALITELEVAEAAKAGMVTLKCAPGAIVTPLAHDAAKDKGIEIVMWGR